MAKVNEKVQIRSVIGSTLIHNDMEIASGDIVLVDKEVADVLIEKGYCVEVKSKVM